MSLLKTAATLLAMLFLALPVLAEKAEPNWPENGARYYCHYRWPNGADGTSFIRFADLPAQAHVFPDGNQIKRGLLYTRIGNHEWSEAVALAWKPREFPDPKYGTNFELTLPHAQPQSIQCKNFQNFGDYRLTFDTCSNGIYQSCFRIFP